MKKIGIKGILAIVALMSLYSCTKKGSEVAETQETPGGLVVETPTEINMIGWRFPITEFYAEELETRNKS